MTIEVNIALGEMNDAAKSLAAKIINRRLLDPERPSEATGTSPSGGVERAETGIKFEPRIQGSEFGKNNEQTTIHLIWSEALKLGLRIKGWFS